MLKTATKWVLVASLAVLIAVAGAWADRDVYSKDETDEAIEDVVEIHDRDITDHQRQLDRIEKGVDLLVDKMIPEDN